MNPVTPSERRPSIVYLITALSVVKPEWSPKVIIPEATEGEEFGVIVPATIEVATVY